MQLFASTSLLGQLVRLILPNQQEVQAQMVDYPVAQGVVTLNGAVAVPVSVPKITAQNFVALTLKQVNGVPGNAPFVAITPNVGFTVTAQGVADASDYFYRVF